MREFVTHWTDAQRARMCELMAAQARGECWIGYWCGDAWGRPANGGDLARRAIDGETQEIAGPLDICTPRALHATRQPHRWAGVRVWFVALHGDVQTRATGSTQAPDTLGPDEATARHAVLAEERAAEAHGG